MYIILTLMAIIVSSGLGGCLSSRDKSHSRLETNWLMLTGDLSLSLSLSLRWQTSTSIRPSPPLLPQKTRRAVHLSIAIDISDESFGLFICNTTCPLRLSDYQVRGLTP
ncbi:hypothetical protein F5Y14DRAFT_431189 [Nemania sp. NC0429]|nr:hypothetical protein F5Y14DRAFT_431189 [Nemania sp. NC0429]